MLCHVMYFCPHFWFYVFRCLCSTMYFWFLGLLLCHTPSYAVWLQVSALSGHVWSSSAKCCTSCKPLSLRIFLLTVPWWASKSGIFLAFREMRWRLGNLHPQAQSFWPLNHLSRLNPFWPRMLGPSLCSWWDFPFQMGLWPSCSFAQNWRITWILLICGTNSFSLLFSQMQMKQTYPSTSWISLYSTTLLWIQQSGWAWGSLRHCLSTWG